MLSFLKKIIFDFDGVLVNNFQERAEQIIAIAHSFGIQESLMEKIREHWGESLDAFLESVLPGINRDMFSARGAELGFEDTAPAIVPGTRRTLALLSKHFSLSVVTNRGRPSLMTAMKERRIDASLFCFILTASELPREFLKPSPKAFQKIILTLFSEGILPEQMLYVGDTLNDFRAASGAGLHFAGIISGGVATPEDFLRVGVPEKHLLETLSDLPGLLGISD